MYISVQVFQSLFLGQKVNEKPQSEEKFGSLIFQHQGMIVGIINS